MVQYSNIPAAWKERRIWNYSCTDVQVLQSDGQIVFDEKAPLRNARIDPTHGPVCSFASSDGKFGWLTFDQAQAQMQLLRDHGLAPVLGIQMKGVPQAGRDEDLWFVLCVDVDVKPQEGESDEAALARADALWQEHCATFSYAERSPGGFGWRIFFLHSEPFKGNKWPHGEVYTGGVDARFIRLTGKSQNEIAPDPELWERLNPMVAARSSEEVEALQLGDIPMPEQIAEDVAGLTLSTSEGNDVAAIKAGAFVEAGGKPDASQSCIAILKIARRREWSPEQALAWLRTFRPLVSHYEAKNSKRDEMKRKLKYWWAAAGRDVAREIEDAALAQTMQANLLAGIAAREEQAVQESVADLADKERALPARTLKAHLTQGIKVPKSGRATIHDTKDLAPFPVEIMNDYFRTAISTCAQTELGIAFHTTLAHMKGTLNRLVYGKMGLMTQSFTAIIAPQAIGKNIVNARQRILTQLLGSSSAARFRFPRPGSEQGYEKTLLSRPASDIEVSEGGSWLSAMGVNGVPAVRGTLSKIRQGITSARNDSSAGYSTGNQTIEPTHCPSVGVIVEGTFEQIVEAFSDVGEEDGTMRRMNFGTEVQVIISNMISLLNEDEEDKDDSSDAAYAISDRLAAVLTMFAEMHPHSSQLPQQSYIKLSKCGIAARNETMLYQQERSHNGDEQGWRFGSYAINVQIAAMTIAAWRAAGEAYDGLADKTKDARLPGRMIGAFLKNPGVITGADFAFARMVTDDSVASVERMLSGHGMFMGEAERNLHALFDVLAGKHARGTLPTPFAYSSITAGKIPAYFGKQKNSGQAIRDALHEAMERGLLTSSKTITRFSMHGAKFTLTPAGNELLISKVV